ncbi:hypothetical protein QQA43_08195 [Mycolicibacterium vanbaalenii]|uniref:hypothetical protein n=1 Tax=Mycolicibacterium vanbaalenii TaxID=110539 RepID=UPI001F44A496|nr:hypothetical protein [Mycolicibacterium vanbaalenii]WND59997.1 hypothetical protein QQA43_08195 [Mycolicibacterium vanbaalenii]
MSLRRYSPRAASTATRIGTNIQIHSAMSRSKTGPPTHHRASATEPAAATMSRATVTIR